MAAPDASVAPIHDRMPLIIDDASYEPWLCPKTPQETAIAICLTLSHSAKAQQGCSQSPGRPACIPVSTA